MSHFTVMVIGENPEILLEPYNENTEVEEYEVGEVSEAELKRFSDFYKEKYDEDTNLSVEELYEKHGDDWNGRSWKKENDVWVEYSTYNPNSKWDWYQLGGRWNGYFKLKEGAEGEKGTSLLNPPDSDMGYVDACKKGDIDIEGMMDEKGKKAAEVYDFVNSELEGTDASGYKPWSHFLKMYNDKIITIEEAREQYRSQPLAKRFSEISSTEEGRKKIGFFANVEDFIIPREKYINNARNSAITPYAVLTDDGWFEKGEMGWFGMSSNEKDDNEWNEEFMKLFNSLPNDTPINLVDCHI